MFLKRWVYSFGGDYVAYFVFRLPACQVELGVTVGDSGLCCCVYVGDWRISSVINSHFPPLHLVDIILRRGSPLKKIVFYTPRTVIIYYVYYAIEIFVPFCSCFVRLFVRVILLERGLRDNVYRIMEEFLFWLVYIYIIIFYATTNRGFFLSGKAMIMNRKSRQETWILSYFVRNNNNVRMCFGWNLCMYVLLTCEDLPSAIRCLLLRSCDVFRAIINSLCLLLFRSFIFYVFIPGFTGEMCSAFTYTVICTFEMLKQSFA